MWLKVLGITVLLAVASPADAPPAISSVSIAPNAVTGGESATGTVTLMAPVPAGGIMIALSSNNPAVSGGASVQVPQGQSSVSFPVSTAPVPASANATLTAAIGSSSASTTLTVNAPCVSTLAVQLSVTNGVTGNGTLAGTVGLNGPAPSGGLTVNLVSGGGNLGKVLIGQGKTSETVNLNLADVTQISEDTVSAQTGSCPAVSAPVKKDL